MEKNSVTMLNRLANPFQVNPKSFLSIKSSWIKVASVAFIGFLGVFLIPSAWAADPFGLPALTVSAGAGGAKNYTLTLQILLLMTGLTFLPALLLMTTSFTRIIIVLSILRQAIGLQQTPSNQILVGLALFLSFFIMSPVLTEVNEKAIQPYKQEQISGQQALDNAIKPFHKFMRSQTREQDLTLFMNLAHQGKLASAELIPMTILIPSFVTSELKTAFEIGFLLFIPFLIIDLVVSSVLMSMGMVMLSPLIVSLPFKIMLFVFVDGWSMIMGTLAASFGLR